MPKVPREVAGFVALPLTLNATAGHMKDVKHYLYVKAHEPAVADEDTIRSLFLVNIPVTATELHIKHLFANQLTAGRVQNVTFTQSTASSSASAPVASTKSSKKRKRQTADELEVGLEIYHLPFVFPSQLHHSGSTAIVTFVDRPSMEASLRASQRAAKSSTEIVWGAGLDTNLPTDLVGLERYKAHSTLQYPSRASLLKIVDNYMTGYAALESARSQENAKKRAAPDEEGFVTVTRGTKGGVLKQEEAETLKAKQKAKEQGLEDFYRFQMREKRKGQAGEFLKKFEADKKKVEEMRKRRGFMKPER